MDTWTQLCAPLAAESGWIVEGGTNLRAARLIGFVFEALQDLPLNGAVYFDDVTLVEPGTPLDPVTAPFNSLVKQLVRRQFRGLWGSRSYNHGLIPLNSVYANVAAVNSTSAVIKLLPTANKQGWVTEGESDAYIATVVTTLNTLMDRAVYLPPRYVDWETLEPDCGCEESPVDAAFLALALYQYRSLPSTSSVVRDDIDSLLRRFNFAAFASPQGWKLAFVDDNLACANQKPGFTDGAYDGYLGEVWVISLAAHLMQTNRIDIADLYHTGLNRQKTFLADPALAHVVHADKRFRAPFLQWLFPLFVDVVGLGVDNYPSVEFATNPYENAVSYQRDVHHALAQRERALFLQPDAGDDGSGSHYEQYSAYDDFGEPDLFMPWSVTFSLLGELDIAEGALRSHLTIGLHGPFGLSDSAQWSTTSAAPYSITARHDFWNVALSTMAMSLWLFQDNAFLACLPEVSAAMQEVFPDASRAGCSAETATPRPTTSTPTATPTLGPCFGDCDRDGLVRVNELVLGVNIALERAALSGCSVLDSSNNDKVEVNELVAAVNSLLRGCRAG